MPISFHCEHCHREVKAPNEAGGKRGKCPHCGGLMYVPVSQEETGELDLAPLDEADEARQRQAVVEAAALQQRLLRERAVPGEPGQKGSRGAAGSQGGASQTPSGVPSARALASLVVNFVEAMSGGKLDRAEQVAGELLQNRDRARALLDEMSGEDLSAYGMPALPRPVLVGFLKQLRSRL